MSSAQHVFLTRAALFAVMGSSGWTGTTKEDCEAKIDYALQRNPSVKFMVQKLEEVRGVLADTNKKYNLMRDAD